MDNHFSFHIANDNLAVTPLENIFINVYMPRARGDYVKVYLYGLKQCFNHCAEPIDNIALAQLFNLTEGDVINAWDYWEKEGIITVKYLGTTQVDITYYSIPSLVMTEDLGNMAQDSRNAHHPKAPKNPNDQRIAEMYQRIQTMYGSRAMSKKDTMTYAKWVRDYQFEPEAVVILVEYALNMINQKEEAFTPVQMLNYTSSIAESWHAAGVRTMTEADAYITQNRTRQKRYYAVFKYLGLRRNPMDWEREMMDAWSEEYGYDDTIIEYAMSRTTKPNIRYLNAILKRWHEAGLTTMEAIVQDAKNHQTKRPSQTPAPVDETTLKDMAIYAEMDAADADWIRQIGEEDDH